MSEIRKDLTKNFATTFNDDKKKVAAQRTVVKNGINASAENTSAAMNNTPIFSIDLGSQKVSNQKQSGRCWLFAAMNMFRRKIEKDLNLKDFELSQSYAFFWDKLEKSNYFLENIIATATDALDSRKVAHLLAEPQADGGQWELAVSIFQKYGVVPKSVMPESISSSSSAQLNKTLNKKLRKDASILRKLVSEKATEEQLQAQKETMLQEIYNILAISLGTPPETFDFAYRDEDNNYHLEQNLTPQRFYAAYIGIDLDQYVNLLNAPTPDKPYHQTYTVEYMGNVIGGMEVKYLNIDMRTLKQAAINQLKQGEPVWFSCDVNQSSSREQGIMSLDMYGMNELFDTDFTMTKAQRLDYGESLLTHAMLLTGVDIVNNKPTKWKVENSWGDKIGTDGFFVMSDDWMNEYTFQVIVRKEFLSAELLADLEKEPVLLPPWDALR